MEPKKRTLSNDELAGRILALESLVVAALGIAIRYGRTPFFAEQVIPVLDSVKKTVRNRIADPDEKISAAGEAETYRYLDHILSNFSESVIPKRPDQEPKRNPDKD
jgi:hypothetical protein